MVKGILVRSGVRHRLKEDKFATTAQDTFSWMQHHSINVVGGILVSAVIIGLALGGYFYMENHEQKASLDLALAMDTLNAQVRPASQPPNPDATEESYGSVKERAQAAQKKFQTLVDQYPHTHAGKASRYFIAITDIQAGKNRGGEAAIRTINACSAADDPP